MAATRILIVDDHPLFREALKQAVSGGVSNAQVSLAGSLDQATALLDKDDDFDLVLLDLRMPGVQGLSGLIYLRAQDPNVPVALITAADDHGLVQKALNLNASGFIPKTAGIDTIVGAVNAILKGDIWAPEGHAQSTAADKEGEEIARRVATLTAQQIRVLMMLKEGLLNKQIAYELDVSEATIKAHVANRILSSSDAPSASAAVRAEAICRAISGRATSSVHR